jgi:putative hydrolase of the HAD superfamily
MGEVVAINTDVFPAVSGYLGMTVEAFNNLAGPDLEKYMDGIISTNDFWERFSIKHGFRINEDLFLKFFKPNIDQQMVSILNQLKKMDRVVCGTNTFDSHYDYLKRHGYYDHFDKVYASNKMGVSKPHSNFFLQILKNEQVVPADAVFVDDLETNVFAAEELGIRSILFQGADRLRTHIPST